MAAGSIRRRGALIAAGAIAALVASVGIGGTAVADDGPASPAVPTATPGSLSAAKLSPTLAASRADRARVFVQLSGTGAADEAGKAAAKSRRAAVKASAASAFATAKGKDAAATYLFTATNAVPGFGADLTPEAVEALAARPDVVKVSALIPKRLETASAAQLVRAVNTWQAGNLGQGVSIGVIDTGIDYTHADFGGAGTPEAYTAAHAASTEPFTPNAKVVGGFDFVGDDYNADPDSDGYQPVPHPDPNPLDCNGHGSHVAGIAAGYGVNADGSTFTGDYAALTSDDLYAMKIGPGTAPAAELYGLRVFGCDGSTDVVIPALDWSLDPNGDGDFSDHLDIVNLSLGSDFAPADDPENAVMDTLAAHGVLPVTSAGNAGDITDAGGSPGNATRALAVASSIDAYQLRDGLRVDAPADVAGIASGQFSVAYPWPTAPDVSGAVVFVSGANADGCQPYSPAEAAIVAGKVVWQTWDDNDATRRCGSAGRSANALAAGAIGAIFDSQLDVFGAGITGSATIPVFQLPKSEADRLRPALLAGTLQVTFSGSLGATVKSITPGITDTLSSFSSRGSHGSIGVVKPDVAAPGDTIASVNVGTGSGVLAMSGTSMASPNVAGIAALVVTAHPTWTAEQLKADLMNTAGHDVYAGDGQTGPIYGPNRVGAGRVDALAAVDNDLLVYVNDVPGAVSASFGVVAAPITAKSVTRTRTLVVENTGTAAKTVSLAYDAITAQPGVTYTVSPSTLTVKPGKKATATVTLTVVPSQLTKPIDPTQDPISGLGVPRQYLSDSSGRVLVTPAGGTALRVPVYAAAKPTSATTAKVVTSGKGASLTSSLAISGTGFDQGSGSEAFTSLVSVLELGATSGQVKSCTGIQIDGCTLLGSDSSGDLRYVGAGSSPSQEWLYFGINTWGQWAVDGAAVVPFVDFDVTGDGEPDYEVFVQNYDGTDVPIAFLVDLESGEIVDLEPANIAFGDTDTNWFDSDTLLIPVWTQAIGLDPTTSSFPITYQVGTFSGYTEGIIDASPVIQYDALDPAVAVADPLYLDQAGVQIPYTLGASATKDTRALVLHLHGAPGDRAEVVKVATGKVRQAPAGKLAGSSTLAPVDEHFLVGSAGK